MVFGCIRYFGYPNTSEFQDIYIYFVAVKKKIYCAVAVEW